MLYFIVFILLVIGAVAVALWASIDEQRRNQERMRALQIADVDSMSGIEFEHYVCCLLRHQGYFADVTKGSGDFGADIIATRSGDRIAFQTKRYAKKVSNKAVNEAFAAMAHYKCSQCAVVTNNYFTSAAKNLAKSTGCLLVDRDELAKWILDFQGDGAWCVEPTLPANNETNASAQQKNDVDPAIIARLRRAAEISHPGDYATQVYLLEQQLEAYESIQLYQAPDLPEHVLSTLIESSTTEYKDDFSTAKYVIDRQVDAYRKMQTICV